MHLKTISELYEEAWDWQATMLQPVGGMQQISNAFATSLGPSILYEAPVTEIAKATKRPSEDCSGLRQALRSDVLAALLRPRHGSIANFEGYPLS